MGQAKQRRAEIEALKSSPKARKVRFVPSTVPGYSPDAGLNSPNDQDSHYWFSVSEFSAYLSRKPPIKVGRCPDGIRRAELSMTVDILDEAGENHIMPAQDQGYVATIDCSRQDLLDLADEVANGSMSIRITGRPYGQVGRSPAGERWRIIRPTKFYGRGNAAGNMLFMQVNELGFNKTDSQAIASGLRRLADQVG